MFYQIFYLFWLRTLVVFDHFTKKREIARLFMATLFSLHSLKFAILLVTLDRKDWTMMVKRLEKHIMVGVS